MTWFWYHHWLSWNLHIPAWSSVDEGCDLDRPSGAASPSCFLASENQSPQEHGNWRYCSSMPSSLEVSLRWCYFGCYLVRSGFLPADGCLLLLWSSRGHSCCSLANLQIGTSSQAISIRSPVWELSWLVNSSADIVWRDVQVRVEEDLKVIKYNKFWGQVLHVILI